MIVIVGAGVIGASVAWHLAKRGVRVRVIDRAPEPGGGSTPKATGGFRAQFATEVEVRLSLLSRDKLRRFEDEIGVDSGYRPYGYLFLARTAEELEALRAAQAVQHACGLTEARMVSAAEARDLSPAVGDDAVIGGTFCPTDGFIRATKILNGYIAAAQRLGVEFTFGCDFHGWRVDGDRVVAAQTSEGDIEADAFVNALGAWSGPPIVPLRRNAVATVKTDLLPDTMPMTVWAGDWFHVRMRDGRALLLWPDTPADDSTWLPTVLRWTRERVPILRDVPIEESWSGFYEMSPDEHALLGRVPGRSNLYIAAGASGHGVMHSPALGELLAALIVDGIAPPAALDPGRFGAR